MKLNVLVDSEKVAEVIGADVSMVDHWLSGHAGDLEAAVAHIVGQHLEGVDLGEMPKDPDAGKPAPARIDTGAVKDTTAAGDAQSGVLGQGVPTGAGELPA